MNLKIEKLEVNSALVIVIKGEIDLYSSPVVRKQILETIDNKIPVILVDMNQVTYMDSSGVATLVEGYKQCNQYNGRFLLSGVQPEVRQVFELTRLDSVFPMYKDRQSALADMDLA